MKVTKGGTTAGVTRTCPACGSLFTGRYPAQTYCSIDCLLAAKPYERYNQMKESMIEMAQSKFWDTHHPVGSDLPPFLTYDEKVDLAKLGTPFVISQVIDGESNYGPCFWLILDIDEAGPVEQTHCTLTMGGRGTNRLRTELLSQMQTFLAENEGEYIAATLSSFKVKDGYAYGVDPIDDDVIDVKVDAEGNYQVRSIAKEAPKRGRVR